MKGMSKETRIPTLKATSNHNISDWRMTFYPQDFNRVTWKLLFSRKRRHVPRTFHPADMGFYPNKWVPQWKWKEYKAVAPLKAWGKTQVDSQLRDRVMLFVEVVRGGVREFLKSRRDILPISWDLVTLGLYLNLLCCTSISYTQIASSITLGILAWKW